MRTVANPVALLFGAYRRQVLALLLLRPGESFHVREIGRVTGIPAGSLHRELRLLADAGLLLREQVGNQVRYRANSAHPIHPELAAIFRKTSGLADVLRDALLPLERKIDLAFVFGSVARGEERSVSDVDVLVAGKASLLQVVKALSAVHSRLGREINPVVLTRRELAAKLKARERFFTRVASEPKIWLIGTEDDLSQPAEDRAA